MIQALNPYSKCHGYPITDTGIYVKYPSSGTYDTNENCEWIINIAGNFTLTFTHFDLHRYTSDNVAVFEGDTKIGEWDGKYSPENLPVLSLHGKVKVKFVSYTLKWGSGT